MRPVPEAGPTAPESEPTPESVPESEPESAAYRVLSWSDAEGVLMAVEVTSYDDDTHQRDRIDKPDAYAAVGIPVYLLVDRDDGTVTVFTCPENGRYRQQVNKTFGAEVKIPHPVGVTLDTEPPEELAD